MMCLANLNIHKVSIQRNYFSLNCVNKQNKYHGSFQIASKMFHVNFHCHNRSGLSKTILMNTYLHIVKYCANGIFFYELFEPRFFCIFDYSDV